MSHLHLIVKGTNCSHISYENHLTFYSNSLASVSYKVNWLTFMCCHDSMTSTGFSDLFYTPSEGMLTHLHKLTNLGVVSISDAHKALMLGAGKILQQLFCALLRSVPLQWKPDAQAVALNLFILKVQGSRFLYLSHNSYTRYN